MQTHPLKAEYGGFPAGSRALVPSNGGAPRGGLEVKEQVSRARHFGPVGVGVVVIVVVAVVVVEMPHRCH